MLGHAVHATATFAELTLAISLGLMMKIIAPKGDPQDDVVRRRTEREAAEAAKNEEVAAVIKANHGRFRAWAYGMFGTACDFFDRQWQRFAASVALVWGCIHWLTAAIAISALFGLAFCPAEHIWAFWWSVFAFILAIIKGMHVHRLPGSIQHQPHVPDAPMNLSVPATPVLQAVLEVGVPVEPV